MAIYAEPVVYDSAVEGVFLRGLGLRVTPALKAKLRELGLDLDQKLKATYPREAWIQMLAVTVAELFPDVSPEEGYRRLGECAINGISNTLMGKAIVSMAKLLGPRRAIRRIPQGFTSVNNFMRMEMEEVADCHFRAHLNESYGHPAYVQGALQAVMNLSDAKDPQVVILESKPQSVSLDVRWAP